MCIVFVSFCERRDYALVLASNRDEEHSRPAAPCGWWDAGGPYAGILAGRDDLKGGTWLGVHPRRGVWSVLTNVREACEEHREHSRGRLPLHFLSDSAERAGPLTSSDIRSRIARVLASAPSYDGFNLLVGGAGELWWLTNRAPRAGVDASGRRGAGTHDRLGHQCFAQRLAPGMHALSNALLDTPWHKVRRGRALFRASLDVDEARAQPPTAASRRRLALELLDYVLSDTERAPASELPRSTGCPPEQEALLSSICVSQRGADELLYAGYGSVAQTVLLVGHDGQSTLVERTMQNGRPAGAPSVFEFAFAHPAGLSPQHRLSPRRGRRVWMLGLAVSSAACLGLAASFPHLRWPTASGNAASRLSASSNASR